MTRFLTLTPSSPRSPCCSPPARASPRPPPSTTTRRSPTPPSTSTTRRGRRTPSAPPRSPTSAGRPVALAMVYADCGTACPMIVHDMKQHRRALPDDDAAPLRPRHPRPRARHAGAPPPLPWDAPARRRLDAPPRQRRRRPDARRPPRRPLPRPTWTAPSHTRTSSRSSTPAAKSSRSRRGSGPTPRPRWRPSTTSPHATTDNPTHHSHDYPPTLHSSPSPSLVLARGLRRRRHARPRHADLARRRRRRPPPKPRSRRRAPEAVVAYDGPAFEMTVTPVGNQMQFEQKEFTVAARPDRPPHASRTRPRSRPCSHNVVVRQDGRRTSTWSGRRR